MHRDLITPFSLRIGEETLRKGYEDQDRKFIQQQVYINGFFNLVFNIVLIIILAAQKIEDKKKDQLICISIQSALTVVSIILILSFKYFRHILNKIQTIYEILSVQVLLYLAKVHLYDNNNSHSILNGFTIGACIFNIIIGFSFINKMIMNLYGIFMMTIYQFTSSDTNSGNGYFIIFTILFFLLSISKVYQDEKQRRLLYISNHGKHYLEDQIISHIPVGIFSTKFNDTTMKFELLTINTKAQQLLHLDQSQQSLDTFLKDFKIDQDSYILQRSDLSMKQNHNLNQELSSNKQKKPENEMSFLNQCRLQMMKMIPTYPRDLQQRKKRNYSIGKSQAWSGQTEKETEVTTKNNNINTHSVTTEAKYNGYYNSLYLSLSLSAYINMSDEKYAIFCINTDPYKRDYYNQKNKNQKYHTFFSNFWVGFEKILISQIRDWKFFYKDFKSTIQTGQNFIQPHTLQQNTIGNNITPSYQLNLQQQNSSQQYTRQSQAKKNSVKSQTDQKKVKSLQKIISNDGGFSQLCQLGLNYKQLNTQVDEGLESYNRLINGINLQISPKKEKQVNGGFTYLQQQLSPIENSHEKGSMNFDYFCLTSESINNIQQFQSIGNSNSSGNNNNNMNDLYSFNQQNQVNQVQNQNQVNGNLMINPQQGIQISSRNHRQIQRIHYNCHKIMYDFQNWYTVHEMEFGQNIYINIRQSTEQLDFDHLISRIISIFEIIRLEKQVKVVKQIKIANLQVNQNSKKLHIVLYNILHNAFLYCKYQSIIQINISENQNSVNIQVVNEILQEEENTVQYFIQNQILAESKNVFSSATFDTLNQFSLNFNQGFDQNDNLNNNNNLGVLARKKCESLGIKVTRYLLKSIGSQDNLKIEVKEQKFNATFDIFMDVNHQRKKQTSIFQRYKKNSTIQPSPMQTDPNQTNTIQINDEKHPSDTIQYLPSESNNSPHMKLGQTAQQIFFDKQQDNNNEFTINIHAIDDEKSKIGNELEETQNRNGYSNKSYGEIDRDSEMFMQQDINEQHQSNTQEMSLPSLQTPNFPNFLIYSKVKTLQYQSMQGKYFLFNR